MTNTTELKALYQLHRIQILLHAKTPDNQYRFPQAFLYAVSHHVYPMWHQLWHDDDSDPFESLYDTKKDFIEELMNDVSALVNAQAPIPTFYELEAKFGRDNRASLIHSFRYCYLNNCLNTNFFGKLLTPQEHPVEAADICAPFKDAELSIL